MSAGNLAGSGKDGMIFGSGGSAYVKDFTVVSNFVSHPSRYGLQLGYNQSSVNSNVTVAWNRFGGTYGIYWRDSYMEQTIKSNVFFSTNDWVDLKAAGVVVTNAAIDYNVYYTTRAGSDLFSIEGDPSAPFALVSWGSTAGVCREALTVATEKGLKVKLLVPYLLSPVNEDAYRRFFRGVKAGLVVEQCYLGQLYRILRMPSTSPRA